MIQIYFILFPEHDSEIGSKKLSENLPAVNLANVKCVCGVNEEGTESMILCTYCGTSQHMVKFCIYYSIQKDIVAAKK